MVAIHAPELFERRSPYRSHDAFLRENVGIDPAILADTLGVTERFICMRQRRLGLRKCKNSPRKADRSIEE